MKDKFTILTVLTVLTALRSCVSYEQCSPGAESGERLRSSAFIGIRTKGAILENVPDVFYLFASVTMDTVPAASNYVYNERMNRVSAGTWESVNQYGNIPETYNVFYWAVGGKSGVTLPAAASVGWPVLRYISPDSIPQQDDIIVAHTRTDGNPDAVELEFGHILSAVEFAFSGEGAFDGKLVSVSVKNISTQGSYTLDAGWSVVGEVGDRTAVLNREVTHADGGGMIMTDTNTLMVVPQTFADSAAVEVTAVVNGETIVASASLSGIECLQGWRACIRLDLSEIIDGRCYVLCDGVILTPWNKEEGFIEMQYD